MKQTFFLHSPMRRVAAIFAVLFTILLITMAYHYYLFKTEQITKDVSSPVASYLEDIRIFNNPVNLKDYIGFDYDGFYIIGPYRTTEDRHQLVGAKWHIDDSFISHLINEKIFYFHLLREEKQILVFTKAKVPMAYALLDRSEGDFIGFSAAFVPFDEQLFNQEYENSKSWHVNTIKSLSAKFEAHNPILKNANLKNYRSVENPKGGYTDFRYFIKHNQSESPRKGNFAFNLKKGDSYTLALVDGASAERIQIGAHLELDSQGEVKEINLSSYDLEKHPPNSLFILVTTKYLTANSCEWQTEVFPLSGAVGPIPDGIESTPDLSKDGFWAYHISDNVLPSSDSNNPFDQVEHSKFSLVIKTDNKSR